MNYNSESKTVFEVTLSNGNQHDVSVTNGADILNDIRDTLQNQMRNGVAIRAIRVVPTCLGCRYNAGAQRDHMDGDGCLSGK